MFPFLVNTNNYDFPLSGDVSQEISPAFFAAMKGTPEVEKEVVARVASYGDQLGALTDAVLSIAEKQGVACDEIDKLREISDAVKDIKATVKADLRGRAEAALRRLEDADPEAYKNLMAKAAKGA